MTAALAEATHSVQLTRMLDASPKAVYRALTEDAHLARWAVPNGFTSLSGHSDPRPGGSWDVRMQAPDGEQHEAMGTYRETLPGRRLVYTHAWREDDGELTPETTVTVTLAPEGDGTRLDFEQGPFASEARRDGHHGGWSEAFDHLEEYVALVEQPDLEFRLTRTLAAPCELVYQVWTETSHLAQWFGPVGLKLVKLTNEVRPGGTFHYGMQTPDGTVMYGRWVYREIAPTRRLSFVVSFADEKGHPQRHPLSEKWPLETLSTVDLEARGGETVMTLRALPIHATAEERAIFGAAHESLKMGWSGTLKQLEAHLAKVQAA